MSCILIVEDDTITAKLFSRIAESEGYKTIHAENGLDALEFIDKFHFDLILADIQMPGMDGIALMKRLKEKTATSSIPMIAITATYRGDHDREFYLRFGFSDYMFKPVHVVDLKKMMRKYLKSPHV